MCTRTPPTECISGTGTGRGRGSGMLMRASPVIPMPMPPPRPPSGGDLRDWLPSPSPPPPRTSSNGAFTTPTNTLHYLLTCLLTYRLTTITTLLSYLKQTIPNTTQYNQTDVNRVLFTI